MGKPSVGMLALCLVMAVAVTAQAQTQPVDEARILARQGKHTEALARLDAHLTTTPGDHDARTLRATVRSWLGRYDDAREDLRIVLAANPLHGDAIPVLARVELWDGHPADAERIAAQGLLQHADARDLMEIRALALEQLGRFRDARQQIDALLALEPSHATGRRLQRRLLDREPGFFAGVTHRLDLFNQDRDPWNETQAYFGRQGGLGSIGVRVYAAHRFSQRSELFEVEAYPRLTSSTYAYVAGAFAASDQTLFPERRFVADLYQAVGDGWELSAGLRRIHFASPGSGATSNDTTVYAAGIQRYQGTWLTGVRAWYVPEEDTESVTVDALLRRYGADGQSYLGGRYSRGRYRDDERTTTSVTTTVSDAVMIDAALRTQRLLWTISAGTRRDTALAGQSARPWQTTLTAGVRARF